MQKKPIIIISILCVISLVLGYLSGLKEEESLSNGDAETNSKKEPEFLKEGLVAYYPFNGNAKDESGNGHDCEAKRLEFAPDKTGMREKACMFVGGSDSLIFDLSDENITESITISCWAKVNSKQSSKAGATRTITIGLDNEGIDFKLAPREFIGAAFYNTNQRGPDLIFSNLDRPRMEVPDTVLENEEQWLQYALTYSSKEGLTLFIDGKMLGNSKKELSPMLLGGNFSYSSIGADGKFIGLIDDVRIYNRALSAEEVKALYEFEKAE